MDEPVFQFTDTVKSEVKDSKITSDDTNYIVDVILSGKKDKIIFPAGGQADIGTISLKPSGSIYKISTQFTGISNENPSAEYVTDSGQSAKEVPLVNTEVLTITGSSTGTVIFSRWWWRICYPETKCYCNSFSCTINYRHTRCYTNWYTCSIRRTWKF